MKTRRAGYDFPVKRRLIVPIFAALSTVAPASAQKPSDVVLWSAKGPAGTVKSGAVATIQLDARIEDGWYVYAMTQPDNGPVPLAIAVPGGTAFALDKKRIAAPVPKIKHDAGFGADTQTYEEKATFTLPVTVSRAGKPGTHKVPIDITFQACNGSICLRPATTTVLVPVTVDR